MKSYQVLSYYDAFFPMSLKCRDEDLLKVLANRMGCREGVTLTRRHGRVYWAIICETRGFIGSICEILPVYDLSPLKAKAAEAVALIANHGL